MIRLLIVDDEAATRRGLMRHINWTALGVDMVQAAQSGEEAWELCQDFPPDLVLSDIRMRGMNGVELCRLLLGKYPQCKVIFISGYSDKEYLKAAIELGAVHYVEKPVNREELQQAVTKALALVFEGRRQNAPPQKTDGSFGRDALFALLRSEVHQGEPGDQGGISPWSSYPCLRVVLLRRGVPVLNLKRFIDQVWERCGLRLLDPAKARVFGEFWDNRTLVLLLCGEGQELGDNGTSLQNLSNLVKEGFSDCRLFLALGSIVTDSKEVANSYQQALAAEKSLFFLGYGQVSAEGGVSAVSNLQHYGDRFRELLEKGEEKGLKELLSTLCVQLKQMRAVNSMYVRNLYFALSQQLLEQCQHRFPARAQYFQENYEKSVQLLESLETLDGITAFLLARSQELFTQSTLDESNSGVVQRVTRLISTRYGEKELSVKELAESVYLTPTYLSGLFKRKTGRTIGETITQVRMEKAAELLLDPQLKLYHVARQVGYEDPNYFCKIFKKQMGLTPSEYRERKAL